MIKIPNNSKWLQVNTSERLGSIYSSKGVDLTDNISSLRVAPRLLTNYSSTDDADLGIPVAFKWYSDRWWAACGSYMFKQVASSRSAYTAFSQDALGSSPSNLNSNYTDAALFAESMYVTAASASVNKLNGTTWSTLSVSGSGSAGAKMLCRFGDRMYMSHTQYKVQSWDTSDAVASMGSSYTLSLLSQDVVITFMRASSDRIWIGTMNSGNGKGKIIAWNGQQTTPNEIYDLDSTGVLSGYVYNDILYCIDTNGSLLEFSGGGFVKTTNLPVPFDGYLFAPLDLDNTDRFIHPNGMTITDGRIRVLVNGRQYNDAQSTLEALPAGVWEYTKGTGLYHKYSPSYTAEGTTTITDYGQKRISRVGALVDAKSSEQTDSRASLLAGMQYYSDATTTKISIFTDDNTETTQKYGQIILPQILATQFSQTWNKVLPRFRKLMSATDSIVVKHRVDKVDPVEITITWTSTSTFTTTTDVSALVGYEIEVLNGTGAGKCAHIVSVSGSGTYTVTLDDTFTGVTGTAKAHYTNWIKDGSYSAQTDNFTEFVLSESSLIVQPKLCFQVTGKWDLYDIFLEEAEVK